MVFHWSLSDSKSPQVSRTLLSILTVLNNAVIGMVSTRPLTSKSSSLFNNHLVTEPKAPITIGIIVTFMFHSFFSIPYLATYPSFQFYSVVSRDSKVDNFASSLFFCWLLLGLLVFWPRLVDPCVCQSPIGVYVCYFLGQVLGCAYTICLYDQVSLCRLSRVLSYIPSAIICCIRLLCDLWFHLCHCIAYICYFVASHLFSLWYDWFLRRRFVLLLGEILFLS